MTKKRFLTKLVLVLLTVTLLLPNLVVSAFATGEEVVGETTYVRVGVVTNQSINFREKAGTSSRIIRSLKKGTEVIILEDGDEWLKVMHESDEGYVYKKYVEIRQPKGIITATSLNVRVDATTESQYIDIVYIGMKVIILDEVKTDDPINPVWYEVLYLDDKVGYVSAKYVKLQTDVSGTYKTVGRIKASALNVRNRPGFSSDIVDSIQEESYVAIVEKRRLDDFYGDWYKIEYGENKVGWVAGLFVEELEWEKLSTAKTSSGSKNGRDKNMKLACDALTATIVWPGETFSWIATMGSCSSMKGYQLATVYVNGKKEEGYGGGVCQVSTTMNMAVKRAGIPTNAKLHSLPVSYAKKEDEASVSYPNLDFSFVNTLEVPILIEMSANWGKVTSSIYVPIEDK